MTTEYNRLEAVDDSFVTLPRERIKFGVIHPPMDTEVAPVERFRGREAFGAIL
jgi:hypothetical protein